MKVIQINTIYKHKSTGRTCYELKRYLESKDIDAYVMYGWGETFSERNVIKINTKLEYYIHNILSRITGFQGYFSIFATRRLINRMEEIQPDIIHLRNLHGNYLNIPLLMSYLIKNKKIQVILNLHDCWIFTGKCAHYTSNKCDKWKSECHHCPVLKQYPKSYFFDHTKKMHNDKKKWFDELIKQNRLQVIGVSNWITDEAKQSFFKNAKFDTVYNWIDTNVFYKRNDKLNNYNFPKDKFIIIGVSAAWSQNSPRFKYFIELSKKIDDSMHIVMVGQSEYQEWPNNITHVNFTKSTNELAKLYSSADVYVHMSEEDTFGKVVAEAMACGLPAIVFNSTALPELIQKKCGYVVEAGDIEKMLEKIRLIQEKGKNYYEKSCIENVKNNFQYVQNAEKILDIYKGVTKNV